MPLTELLRMFNENVDATNDRAKTADISRIDSDFVELVWENGQIMTHGQSSKARKYPSTNDLHTYIPKSPDCRDDTGSKMTKFSTMDTAFSDFPLSVPSCELGLDQDEMVPWLSYPTEDALHGDYACNFLPELSTVTLNDTSTENHIQAKERKSGFLTDGPDKVKSLRQGDAHKAASNTGQKYSRGESSDVPQTSSPFQHNVLRSGTSGITGENVSCPSHLASRDSSLSAFSSLRLQKLNGGQSSTSSGFTNFSYFSRPAALARANQQIVNSSKRLEIGEQRCTVTSSNPVNCSVVNLGSGFSQKEMISNNQSTLAPVSENLEILPTKTNEELLLANQAIYREDVARKDILLPRAYDLGKSKAVMDGDKILEPVVAASSVCSGNSVERASSDSPAHNLKRKSRETTESEDPSEEVEGEPVGPKKAGHARFGSKRTRAAEVHNLSERRRRDRINEKMRSLQELIPNCNKVDKASMLDEAIEYLKTLQLQVQMLSMGAGFYMPPMMIPPGMQPIHGAHMPHFSPMGLGMGLGMGFGMNMLDVNNGMKMLPFQGPHYPIPGAGAQFHGMPGPSLQGFGHPGHGLPMSMQRGPVHQVPGPPPSNLPMGLNLSGATASKVSSHLAPSSSSKDAGPQVMPSNNLNSSIHQAPNQVSNERIQTSTSHNLTKAIDASAAAEAPHGTDVVHS